MPAQIHLGVRGPELTFGGLELALQSLNPDQCAIAPSLQLVDGRERVAQDAALLASV